MVTSLGNVDVTRRWTNCSTLSPIRPRLASFDAASDFATIPIDGAVVRSEAKTYDQLVPTTIVRILHLNKMRRNPSSTWKYYRMVTLAWRHPGHVEAASLVDHDRITSKRRETSSGSRCPDHVEVAVHVVRITSLGLRRGGGSHRLGHCARITSRRWVTWITTGSRHPSHVIRWAFSTGL